MTNAQARTLYDQASRDSLLFGGTTSPFWYRGYFLEPLASAAQVDSTLIIYQVKHIIVGHTITDTSLVGKYNGKVIGINVDQHNGYHKALLIAGNHFFEVDAKGKRLELMKP